MSESGVGELKLVISRLCAKDYYLGLATSSRRHSAKYTKDWMTQNSIHLLDHKVLISTRLSICGMHWDAKLAAGPFQTMSNFGSTLYKNNRYFFRVSTFLN